MLQLIKLSLQRCQKCRIERCYKAGMLEKYVRRKKNRTRTMRILENMKRPSVIVKSYTAQESDLLSQALQAWRIATGQSINFTF